MLIYYGNQSIITESLYLKNSGKLQGILQKVSTGGSRDNYRTVSQFGLVVSYLASTYIYFIHLIRYYGFSTLMLGGQRCYLITKLQMYLNYVDNHDYFCTIFMVSVMMSCAGLCHHVICYWYSNVLLLGTRYACSSSLQILCTDDVTIYMYGNKLLLRMTLHMTNIVLYMLFLFFDG